MIFAKKAGKVAIFNFENFIAITKFGSKSRDMRYLASMILICFLLASCAPEYEPSPFRGAPPLRKKILVDASRDGGVWWFPQAGSNNPDQPHQGKRMADLLRAKGFIVDELTQGSQISSSLLASYDHIIRANAFTNYTNDELIAYQEFLNRNTTLLLFNDHLQNSSNDNLSALLGLNFEGSYTGNITQYENHPITNGVPLLYYNAGSYIVNYQTPQITPLGYVTANGVRCCAMGIRPHPSCKIFFIGEINTVETLPPVFTDNLFTWLYN